MTHCKAPVPSPRWALFLDVDGTYAHRGVVPAGHVAVVRAARARGHAVLLCTGRPRSMLQPRLLEAGFDGAAWGPATAPPDVVMAGSDEGVLLFAYGRRDLGASGLTVTGDVSLASRFKELVPGP